MTILLGVAGSFLGGYLAGMWRGQPLDATQPANWIGSIVGAFLLLLLYGLLRKKA
jgi:uncharacterized membrane protein YeaQ/YmgE (transglycosylase-associated protein family)